MTPLNPELYEQAVKLAAVPRVAVVEAVKGGEWTAYYPSLPQCRVYGFTMQSALAELENLKPDWLWFLLDEGELIPPPDINPAFCGDVTAQLHYMAY